MALESWPSELHGYRVSYFESLPSTQVQLRQDLLQQRLTLPAVYVAGSQTQGKGREANSWYSPAHNLYCSLAQKPQVDVAEFPWAGMLLAKSVVLYLRKEWQLEAFLKWPNDVWVEQKKIAGILGECLQLPSQAEVLLLGLGVNVNLMQSELPPELIDSAASLKIFLQRDVDVLAVLSGVLKNFHELLVDWERLGSGNFSKRLQTYLSDCGKTVQWQEQGQTQQGLALGLSERGGLLVEQGKHTRELLAGEVRQVRATATH